MPGLLNYLEMIESGEIIEKRIEKNNVLTQEENDDSKILNKIKPSGQTQLLINIKTAYFLHLPES